MTLSGAHLEFCDGFLAQSGEDGYKREEIGLIALLQRPALPAHTDLSRQCVALIIGSIGELGGQGQGSEILDKGRRQRIWLLS